MFLRTLDRALNPTPDLIGFSSWEELVDYVSEGRPVYYHAPLDFRPALVRARVSGATRRRATIRVAPFGDADAFTADRGHLGRFRRPA